MNLKKISKFTFLFLGFLTFVGCGLFSPSIRHHSEPAGGYQFDVPSNWKAAKPTSDLLSTDSDVVVYTTFIVPEISASNQLVQIAVVRNAQSSKNAVEKFIRGVDWDFALIKNVSKYTDFETKLPSELVKMQVQDLEWDWIVYELESGTYGLVHGTGGLNFSDPDDVVDKYRRGFDMLIKTFDKFE